MASCVRLRVRTLFCVRVGVGTFGVTSVRDEGESCWGWIHVVSILIAVALHGIALYAVASLFNKPVPQQKPLTVVVRMQKASPASDAAGPPSGAQQAATPPSRRAKSLHKTTLPPSGHEIPSSDVPSSPASSMASTPLSVIPNASGTQASESPSSSPGIAVGSDLAFFCSVRPALVYPRISRKMGEEGIVILHVEWDQKGQITSSRVQRSSGFRRLDDAALTAINGWRCMAKQGGVPVRAVAVQPFRFQLQEE